MSLTAALIGLGQIGMGFDLYDAKRVKPASHMGCLKALKHKVELKAVYDTDLTRGAIASNYYEDKLPLSWPNYEAFKDVASGVDIFVIATPEDTHYEIILDALKLKPKVIFCEKPLSNNCADAVKAQWACEKEGAKLAVNHTRRWQTSWRKARSLLDEGAIGSCWGFKGFFTGDWGRVGSHMADLANWYECVGHEYCAEATRIENADYLLFEVHLVGTEGRIVVCCNGRHVSLNQPLESRHYSGVKELELRQHFAQPFSESPLLKAYENIVAHLEKEEPLACTGRDGVEALRRLDEWGQWEGLRCTR